MSSLSAYLLDQLDRAIYVRGAQGENVLAKPDPEGWIRFMETTRRSDYATHTADYDANAERAIVLYRARVAEGINPIRAFDCSGLIMYYALEQGIANKDLTAAAIYRDKCKPITGPATIRGQLVFKGSKPSSITHVGVYAGADGVIESKGRAYGVVLTPYDPTAWNFTGEWSDLMRCWRFPAPLAELDLDELSIIVLQSALNACGYTDDDGHPLDTDGKLGKRTKQAVERFVRYNLPALKIEATPEGRVWLTVEK